MVYKRKLKDWNCTKRRESKISKSVEMWFNTIGLTTNHEDVVITSFPSRYGKAAWPLLIHSLTGRQPYSFPLFLFLSLTPRFLFLLTWLELSWIISPLSADEIILRQFQLSCLQILPLTEPAVLLSPLITKWSDWLSLKRRPSWKFKYI